MKKRYILLYLKILLFLLSLTSVVSAKVDGLTPIVSQLVESVEINHVYDSNGKFVLSQVIARDYSNVNDKLEIVGWLHIRDHFKTMTIEEYETAKKEFQKEWYKKHKEKIDFYNKPIVGSISFLPFNRDKYVVLRFCDNDCLREIVCKSYFETWTQYDREAIERDYTTQHHDIFDRVHRKGFLLTPLKLQENIEILRTGDTLPRQDNLYINIDIP